MSAPDVNTCFTYTYGSGVIGDWDEAVTQAAISANYIDLDVAGIRISGARPPWLIVRTMTVFATVVSLGIKLITDSAIPVLDAVTAKDVMVYRIDVVTAGANALIINAPLPNFDYQRYLALEYEPYTNATGGTLIGYLSSGPETAVTDIANVVEAGT
jgi:hypothetical protein